MQTSQSQSQVCPNCLASVVPGTRFCPQCGTQLTQPGAAAPAHGFKYQPLQPGQMLRNYRVLSPLSRGGMGAVYFAEEDFGSFGRHVVIKEMLDYFDPSSAQELRKAQERFTAEAKTLSQLKHSGIPQIYNYFSVGPSNYIVMEYIEGEDLEQRLTRTDRQGRRIPGRACAKDEVVRWGIALCRVLEHLAQRTPAPVVHHDIKPANIILDKNSGEVRLVDFGTAKARLQQQAGGAVGMQQSSIYGTAGYMAPEQVRGTSEPRSDVYALAATLYHLATDDDPGVHPFTFPEIKRLGKLEQALAGALERDVKSRLTAAELRVRLEGLASPGRPHCIQAPDGAEIHDIAALVAWCEANWDAAAKWLYNREMLSRQVAQLWGKTKLADELRAAVSAHPDCWDAGLDAALAACDPQGFGSAPAGIHFLQKAIDFGALHGDSTVTRTIEIQNDGRRHVRAQADSSTWIAAQTPMDIAPQTTATYNVTANSQMLRGGGSIRGTVRLSNQRGLLAELPIYARAPRIRLSWPRLGAIPSINFYDIPVVALILLIAAAVTGVSVFLAKSGLVAASVLSQTGNPAITIGVLALFFAYVGLIVQGARQRFIWALAIAIFSPLAAIVFSIKHWWRARTPAWIGVSGIVLGGSGVVALAFAPAQTVISNHGDFEIDKPANWSIQRDLNPEANLQIGNSTSYLIAFSDSRRIVGATTLQDYAHEQTQTMAHGLEDANVSEPSTLVIDGHAAVEYVVRGVADRVDGTGIITIVETPSTFYRIISWTETRLFQNQQATLRQVIRSFRVRTASP